jgi:hypothetical protein
MNSKTHKVVSVKFIKKIAYAVPIDWDCEELSTSYGDLYYKGEEVKNPKMVCIRDDYDDGEEEDFQENEYDLEEWFDCESE